jgi:hypothetical protein
MLSRDYLVDLDLSRYPCHFLLRQFPSPQQKKTQQRAAEEASSPEWKRSFLEPAQRPSLKRIPAEGGLRYPGV